LAVVIYVLADGFDIGVGILFLVAPRDADRDTMIESVEPVWDGNETWLVLGGTLLWAAFPAAYYILLPAFYLPMMDAKLIGEEFGVRTAISHTLDRIVAGLAVVTLRIGEDLPYIFRSDGIILEGDRDARPKDFLSPPSGHRLGAILGPCRRGRHLCEQFYGSRLYGDDPLRENIHGRCVAIQMAEIAIPRNLFGDILRLIAELRPSPDPAPG
jgi:Cytochrome bd terminal oxidase subunit II